MITAYFFHLILPQRILSIIRAHLKKIYLLYNNNYGSHIVRMLSYSLFYYV